MPKLKAILLLSIILTFTLTTISSAVAETSPPTFPSSFYGTVKMDGENVPGGTPITAKINGEEVASTEVLEELHNGDSVYTIKIQGDDSLQGATIDFYIDGVQADQTGTWMKGENTHLDLSIGETIVFKIYLPLILH